MVLKTRKKINKKINKPKTRVKLNACSPQNEKPQYTCYTKQALIKIINHLNSLSPDHKINFSVHESKQLLWNKIDKVLNSKCDSELCWSQLSSYPNNLRSELLSHFKPIMPKKWLENHREWLSTLDIENVLNQYQKKHKNYKSYGAVPIDFDHKFPDNNCVVNDLCNINVSKLLNNNISLISVVFNLDKHNEPGSHWIAMYANFNSGDIYFFDSYGYEPPREVCILMKRLKQQLSDLNIKSNIKISKLRHQYKNSECGMYCLYFIISLLQGKTFTDLTKKSINDDKMEENRDIYFVKYKNTKYL